MKVYGKDFEGADPWRLLPLYHTGHDSDLVANLRTLRKHLDDGGRVFIEITKGARKGTIGELVIPSTDLDELYGARGKLGIGGERRKSKVVEWQLKFDDRDNVIKIPQDRYDYKWNGVLRFGCAGTTWVYTSKERPKVEPLECYDHFGVKLEVDQTVLFLEGMAKDNDYNIRFGKIVRISDKGTIWVDAFKTREGHKLEQFTASGHKNIIVLNGDVRDKMLMGRLQV